MNEIPTLSPFFWVFLVVIGYLVVKRYSEEGSTAESLENSLYQRAWMVFFNVTIFGLAITIILESTFPVLDSLWFNYVAYTFVTGITYIYLNEKLDVEFSKYDYAVFASAIAGLALPLLVLTTLAYPIYRLRN